MTINKLTGKPIGAPYRKPEMTIEDIAYTNAVAARCGYREPPPELIPTGPMGEDPKWFDLAIWFRSNLPPDPGVRTTGDWDSAILVFISRKWATPIGEAYARTDSWMKSTHRFFDQDQDVECRSNAKRS